MNKYLLFFVLLFLATTGISQQISLQAGQTISKLKFEDSQGMELKNLKNVNNFYMMAEFRKSVFTEPLNGKLFGSVGIDFNGYGSKGSDPVLDNFYEWDMSYIGIILGLDYEYYSVGKLTGFVGTKISTEFLVRGSQTINTQVFDLVGADDFNTPMFFFRGFLGVEYEITSNASIFAQYMIGKSYNFFSSEEGKLNIIAQNFGIGIFTDLTPNQAPKKKRKR